MAEHERNVIKERMKAGLSSARAREGFGGRSHGLSEPYQAMASEVRQVYEANIRSTD